MIQKMLKNAKKSKKAKKISKRKDVLTFAIKRLQKELNTMIAILPPMSAGQVIM